MFRNGYWSGQGSQFLDSKRERTEVWDNFWFNQREVNMCMCMFVLHGVSIRRIK